MKLLLLVSAILISSSLFCQSPVSKNDFPVIKWDSTKTNLRYQYEDSIMRKMIIGVWQDQNSILYIKKKGQLEIKFLENNKFDEGKWSIDRGILITKFSYFSYTLNNYEKKWDEIRYIILEFSLTHFKYQAINSPDNVQTIWIANRISK